MWSMLWPILLVVVGNTFYNICAKSTPGSVNGFASLTISYLVAGVCALITMIGTCGLRLLWVFLVFPAFPTHAVIVFCFPVGWAVTGIVQQIRLHWLLRRLTPRKELTSV